MKKLLFIIAGVLLFASCQVQQKYISFPVKNTYEEYYSLRTSKNYDAVWDLLITEILINN